MQIERENFENEREKENELRKINETHFVVAKKVR